MSVDFERVRRIRRTGMRGLGQPLKSFRDTRIDYPAYRGGRNGSASLDALGPMEMPKAGGI